MHPATGPDSATRDHRVARIPGLDRVTSLYNAIGSLAIFCLMCLICADVAGRYFFAAPIPGVTEIVEMSIVAIVFAQLADATARDRMTRADSLLLALRTRRPAVAAGIDVLAACFGTALMAILAYGVIPSMLNDYRNGYYTGTVGIFTFPSWPVKAVIALGVLLTALQLVLFAVRAVQAVRTVPTPTSGRDVS